MTHDPLPDWPRMDEAAKSRGQLAAWNIFGATDLRGCDTPYVAKIIDAEIERARREALEEAAKVAEEHASHEAEAEACCGASIAAAIRARNEGKPEPSP